MRWAGNAANRIALAMLLVMALGVQSAVAAPGSPDLTFNGSGTAIAPVGPGGGVAFAVAAGPDDEVVAGGYAQDPANPNARDMAVARWLADGSLDQGFGDGGVVVTRISEAFDVVRAVAVQDDGSIVAAGYARPGTHYDLAIVRYLPDGSLDASFGDAGIVLVSFDVWMDQAHGIAIQPDGRIVVAGQARIGSVNDVVLVRALPDGTLDPSFGDGGMVSTKVGSSNDAARALTLDGEGRILVAGFTAEGVGQRHDAFVLRYLTDGSLDPAFADTGIARMEIGDGNNIARGVAVDSAGRILVSGYGDNDAGDYDLHAARLLDDGSLDPAFGDAGVVTLSRSATNTVAYGIAVDVDDQLVALGEAHDGQRPGALAAAFSAADGSLDESWGTAGIAEPRPGDAGTASVLLGGGSDAHGRVLGAGYAVSGGTPVLAAVRLGDPLDAEPPVEPPPGPLPGCSGRVVTRGQDSVATITWQASDHPTLAGYELAWRHRGASAWTHEPVTQALAMEVRGLVPGRSHQFRVRAVAGDGAHGPWCDAPLTVVGGGAPAARNVSRPELQGQVVDGVLGLRCAPGRWQVRGPARARYRFEARTARGSWRALRRPGPARGLLPPRQLAQRIDGLPVRCVMQVRAGGQVVTAATAPRRYRAR